MHYYKHLSILAGVQRVKDSGGKYALLMETVKAEYITATNCDLITYGESLSSLGWVYLLRFTSVIYLTLLLCHCILFDAELFLDFQTSQNDDLVHLQKCYACEKLLGSPEEVESEKKE